MADSKLVRSDLADHLRLVTGTQGTPVTGAPWGHKITTEEIFAYLVDYKGLKRSGGPSLQEKWVVAGRGV